MPAPIATTLRDGDTLHFTVDALDSAEEVTIIVGPEPILRHENGTHCIVTDKWGLEWLIANNDTTMTIDRKATD